MTGGKDTHACQIQAILVDQEISTQLNCFHKLMLNAIIKQD